jgi:hypothetical protein
MGVSPALTFRLGVDALTIDAAVTVRENSCLVGDASTFVAVIGGTMGCLGGVLACRMAFRTARFRVAMQKRIAELQAEVAHALGNLKRRGSQSLSNADGALKNLALLEEAFTEAWDCLQRVKDSAEHAVAGSRIWMAPEMVTEVDAAVMRIVELCQRHDHGSRSTFLAWREARGRAGVSRNALGALRLPSVSEKDRAVLIEILKEEIPKITSAQSWLTNERATALAVVGG